MRAILQDDNSNVSLAERLCGPGNGEYYSVSILNPIEFK